MLNAPLTGTQRYTRELLGFWKDVDTIAPGRRARGLSGHCWEQLLLPAKVKVRLLFSPANTGPLGVSNQVLTIHDMSVFDCPEGFTAGFLAWYRFLLPRLCRKVKQIITVSEFIKNRILAHTGVSESKIAVIPNGVATDFCPDAVSRLDLVASSLHLPSREYVLVVGSLEPRKNLARLFRAWGEIQSRLPKNLWLVVVGAQGSSKVFSKISMQNLPPRVFLAGRVNDASLAVLYAGASIFVYISLYEGFGLPLLEAMASGVPVVAGNRSSLPEVVSDAGLLVDPEDAHKIAEAIQTLIENPGLRQDLSCRGLARAKQYSWDRTARATWNVLASAARQ